MSWCVKALGARVASGARSARGTPVAAATLSGKPILTITVKSSTASCFVCVHRIGGKTYPHTYAVSFPRAPKHLPTYLHVISNG